ncbi:sulfite oxidase heme-binding subunit YedZ [Gemmatirosa kalamazoonensis]|uniref:sulfite oxidase heme-binding subunit YedZ n=1 Tax=Gemmatirosa kalamazoonensis TaxID=861299 RepID=UPI000CE442FB|nr:protein-methionine-sulfoxide reductase heme-binding subunit MsrQ [Gemmatirosa kalamazoonensis]
MRSGSLGSFLGTRRARLVVWLLGALPALWLAWQLWRAWNGEPHTLGREPVKGLEHATGDWTIRFLAATLAVTPLRQLTGWNWLARYRRILGLLAFGYACTHLTTYAVLDLELDLGEVAHEIVKRPYLVVGFTAWLLLLPLAVTSTTGWIRRLGGKRWDRLHAAVYAVVALGLVHFWWSQKKDKSDPLAWALVFAVLFAWRAWRAVVRRRDRGR